MQRVGIRAAGAGQGRRKGEWPRLRSEIAALAGPDGARRRRAPHRRGRAARSAAVSSCRRAPPARRRLVLADRPAPRRYRDPEPDAAAPGHRVGRARHEDRGRGVVERHRREQAAVDRVASEPALGLGVAHGAVEPEPEPAADAGLDAGRARRLPPAGRSANGSGSNPSTCSTPASGSAAKVRQVGSGTPSISSPIQRAAEGLERHGVAVRGPVAQAAAASRVDARQQHGRERRLRARVAR